MWIVLVLCRISVYDLCEGRKQSITLKGETMKSKVVFEWTVGDIMIGAKLYKVIKRASGVVQVWLYGCEALNGAEPMISGTIEDARAFWKANH